MRFAVEQRQRAATRRKRSIRNHEAPDSCQSQHLASSGVHASAGQLAQRPKVTSLDHQRKRRIQMTFSSERLLSADLSEADAKQLLLQDPEDNGPAHLEHSNHGNSPRRAEKPASGSTAAAATHISPTSMLELQKCSICMNRRSVCCTTSANQDSALAQVKRSALLQHHYSEGQPLHTHSTHTSGKHLPSFCRK